MEIVVLCGLIPAVMVGVLYLWQALMGRRKSQSKTVPGPSVLDSIRVLTKKARDSVYLSEWAKKYGNIVQVDLLFRKVIVIYDVEIYRKLVKDVRFRESTNDRPYTFTKDYLQDGNVGITQAPYGPALMYRRRVFHNIMKFYGEGKGHFETILLESLANLSKTLKHNERVELSVILKRFIIRLLHFILTGDNSPSSEEKLDIIENFGSTMKKILSVENEVVLYLFPFLRFVPGLRFKRLCEETLSSQRRLHKAYFYDMKATLNPLKMRGLVDELLVLQNDQGQEIPDVLRDDVIRVVIEDMINAGHWTTACSLVCVTLYLIKHQDIQERLHQEIQKVIGNETPQFHHKQHIPLVEAIMLEMFRLTSFGPYLVPHMVTKDLTVDNYLLPKSSGLVMNAWYNHHCDDFWEEPFSFKPDRFLDDNGQLLDSEHPRRKRMIIFGYGPRSCPGEVFARSRLFLIVTYLVQKFQFLPPGSEDNLPSGDPRDWPNDFLIFPPDFQSIIKVRHSE